jgi:predicted Zn-dependent protease with MMP-like domain
MRSMERERFEELVRRALTTVPDEIAARIDNVDVEVQAWPSRRQLIEARVPPGSTLLGLYQGVPLTKRNSAYNLVPPDRITIFQGPIEGITQDEDQLVDRVREVVVHEVAHHFGISDARLSELERERRARS